MTHKKLRSTISLVCLALGMVHYVCPAFSLDTTSIILLVIAIAPWLAPVIKSVELPGGFKIEVQDIKSATDKVTSATSIPTEPVPPVPMHPFVPPPEPEVEGPQPQPQFQQPEEADVFSLIADVAKKDPNLALVAFRIELEKRLAALAAQYGISDSGR